MSTTSEPAVKVPFFKKGKSRPTTARKRSTSPSAEKGNTGPSSSEPSTSKSQVVLPTKKAASNLLSAGTKRTASQRTNDYDDDEDHDAEPRRDTLDVKWTSKGSNRDYALEILAGDEAEQIMAKRAKTDKKEDSDEDVPDDGQYHGQKAYKSHLKKNKEVPKAMRVGPQRSSGSTIRTVTIVDYQPDVCKDYKGKNKSILFYFRMKFIFAPL
jgi:RING finger protein 113A